MLLKSLVGCGCTKGVRNNQQVVMIIQPIGVNFASICFDQASMWFSFSIQSFDLGLNLCHKTWNT